MLHTVKNILILSHIIIKGKLVAMNIFHEHKEKIIVMQVWNV